MQHGLWMTVLLAGLPAILSIAGAQTTGTTEPPPHNSGKTIFESERLRVTTSVAQAQWCFAQSSGAQANINIIWRVGADEVLSGSSSTYHRDLAAAWPAIEKECAHLSAAYISNYIAGVRLIAHAPTEVTESEQMYGRGEVPLNSVLAYKDASGKFTISMMMDTPPYETLAAARTGRKTRQPVALPTDAPTPAVASTASSPTPAPSALVLSGQTPNGPAHYAGETLFEDALVRVTSNVNQFGQWCWPTPRLAGQNTAKVSVIFKGGPETDVSATQQYEERFRTSIWPEIAKRCQPNLRDVTAESYLRGVRIADRDGSELSYEEPLLPDELERSLYTVRINKRAGTEELVFVPGHPPYHPKSLAALRAQNGGQTADPELAKSRASALAAYAIDTALRASMQRVVFNASGLRNAELLERAFHGEREAELESSYRFRLAYVLMVTAYSIVCPKELPNNAELVAVYEPVYGESVTTWMTGRGFMFTTSVPVQTGERKIAEVRASPRYAGRLWAYTHDSSRTGISGGGSGLTLLDVFDPARSAERQRVTDDMHHNVTQLLSNYSCSSGELKVLVENLFRISQRMNSLQEDAIQQATQQAVANAKGAQASISERRIIEDFVRSGVR